MNSHFRAYIVHYAAALAGIAAVIAKADPAILTALGVNPATAVAVLGGSAALVALLHAMGIDPAQPSSGSAWPPGTKSFVAGMFVCILSISVLSAVTACKTAPSASVQAGISVAVTVATGAAIQHGTNDPVTWTERAVAFKAIAVKIKTVNDAGNATLATLAADLQPEIAKLGPADVLAANVLVAALQPYLDQEMSANPSLKNLQATIDGILSAVITTCEAYGAA